MISIIQINLHHCIVASNNLILHLNRYNIDVALIQEPWVRGKLIMGLKDDKFNLIFHKDSNKKRACILIKKKL